MIYRVIFEVEIDEETDSKALIVDQCEAITDGFDYHYATIEEVG